MHSSRMRNARTLTGGGVGGGPGQRGVEVLVMEGDWMSTPRAGPPPPRVIASNGLKTKYFY